MPVMTGRHLEGRRALVTGGASGIGRATVNRLAADGASVIVNYIGDDPAHEVVEEVAAGGGRAIPIEADIVEVDVADEASCKAMVEATEKKFGRLDILINNAGIQTAADSHEMDIEDFDRVLAVNLRGAYLCAR